MKNSKVLQFLGVILCCICLLAVLSKPVMADNVDPFKNPKTLAGKTISFQLNDPNGRHYLTKWHIPIIAVAEESRYGMGAIYVPKGIFIEGGEVKKINYAPIDNETTECTIELREFLFWTSVLKIFVTSVE